MKKFQERDPRLVDLDAVECCALANGFEKNPETVSQLTALIDSKKLKLYEDELINTEHMSFVPNDEIQTAYTQIADAELKRLEGANITFGCVHSSEEHQKALQSIKSRFSKPVN